MLKLILVDDEEDVREGLMEQIHWETYGYIVTDRAENGQEAMEMIERSRPDVVVTDIQMPFMDGLQLAEWIRENYPLTKVIILTGYDEFEYARKAITLQIDEYVLKPFSSQELVQILLKVKEQIEAEVAQTENIHLLRAHYARSLPILREMFLAELMTTRMSLEDIRMKCETFNLSLTEGAYLTAVISPDTSPSCSEANTENSRETVSLRNGNNRNLQLFAVRNIADELSDSDRNLVFIAGEEVILITHGDLNAECLTKQTFQLLEVIREKVEKYLKLTVTIGASAIRNTPESLYLSYQEARQAVDYRLVHGNNRVIWIEDVEASRASKPVITLDERNEQRLIRSIKVGTEEERRLVISSMFEEQTVETASIQDYQIYWLEIMALILRLTKESGTNPQELFGSDMNSLIEITSFTGPDELKNRLRQICDKLACNYESERHFSARNAVEEAKAFIHKNYSDSDLSIGSVCKLLHISTGYFSSIFKKETKMTFVTYLMQVRMNAAKEMLRTTTLKAFEIAEKSGFSDPNYFSFCFRKRFGVSPKEYRTAGEG